MPRTKDPSIKQGVISDCCQAPVFEGNKCKDCRQICNPIKPDSADDLLDLESVLEDEDYD